LTSREPLDQKLAFHLSRIDFSFLEVYHRTGDESWQNLALRLVDQVHYILGRHREDDYRTGRIIGRSEEEGRSIKNRKN
jgi:hypothetical protein